MKDFLIEMFEINTNSNIRMIKKCRELPEPSEAIRLLSHLANCQYKWLDRLLTFPEESTLDWWTPEYSFDELPHHFTVSAGQWITYLTGKSEDELHAKMSYIGYDGTRWECPLKDIALQLNFHCFHHRAQIQMMLRSQGITPPFIDYIGYKQKKAGAE